MKKLLIIGIVGISLSAFGQAFTNLNSGNKALIAASFTAEAQDSIQRFQRLHNWAVKEIPGFAVATNTTTTVTNGVTNIVSVIVTNNVKLSLTEAAIFIMQDRASKVSRTAQDVADQHRTAIKLLKTQLAVNAPAAVDIEATDPQ